MSFLWDGATLLITTAAASTTVRNLQTTGSIRLGLGHTRDVIMIEGAVEPLSTGEISAETGDAFAVKAGFDPRD